MLPLQVMHGALPILGYRIGPLGFVTDMLTAPEATYEALRGVDVLIVNALRPFAHGSHQTIDDAMTFAHKVGAKETYLIHMSHQAGLHVETDAQLPQHVQLAYDGQVIEL